MKAYAETVTAIGCPILFRNIGSGPDLPALVARWKHGDASVETNAADALRIALRLCGGHTVREVRGSKPPLKVIGGGVSVFAPDRHSHLEIEGSVDVVAIFISPAYLKEAAGAHAVYEPSLDVHDAQLQAAALRLFLIAQRNDPDDGLLMQTSVWRIVEHLLVRQTSDRLKTHKRGVPPQAMRRIEELIYACLASGDTQLPNIQDLAKMSGMSLCHFIRAFRRTTGATPHQYVLKCRIERAMVLLALPERSIGEVADSTGYASPSHFVASFKQRLGLTPANYRQAVLGRRIANSILSHAGKGCNSSSSTSPRLAQAS
jgi:AraC family transcriptional regulator